MDAVDWKRFFILSKYGVAQCLPKSGTVSWKERKIMDHMFYIFNSPTQDERKRIMETSEEMKIELLKRAVDIGTPTGKEGDNATTYCEKIAKNLATFYTFENWHFYPNLVDADGQLIPSSHPLLTALVKEVRAMSRFVIKYQEQFEEIARLWPDLPLVES